MRHHLVAASIAFLVLALIPVFPADRAAFGGRADAQENTVTFAGNVWLGAPEARETGVAGAKVVVYAGEGCDRTGERLALAATDAGGGFRLEAGASVAEGYIVVVNYPPGYMPTGAEGPDPWAECGASALQSVISLGPGPYAGLNFWAAAPLTSTPEATSSPLPTATATPTANVAPPASPTQILTPTATRTQMPTPTATTGIAPTATRTQTPAATVGATPTATRLATDTPTRSPAATDIPATSVPSTAVASRTATRAEIVYPAVTATGTPTPRFSQVFTPTPTLRAVALTATALAHRPPATQTTVALTATALAHRPPATQTAIALTATALAHRPPATQTAIALTATALAHRPPATQTAVAFTATARAGLPPATQTAVALTAIARTGQAGSGEAADTPVLINEVNAAGPAAFAPDQAPAPAAPDALIPYQWVELLNRTDRAVTLRGWSLENATGTDLLPDMTLPPHGYALLVADAAYFHQQYPTLRVLTVELPGHDVGGPGGLDPSPHSDHVVIRDDHGVVMDAMSWGSDTTAYDPSSPAVAPGHSLEREPVGRDTGRASDFVDRSPPTPGGWKAPAAWAVIDRRLPANEGTRDLFFSAAPTPLEVARTPLAILISSLLLAILMALVFGVCGTVLDNTVREQETTLGDLLGRLPVIGPAARDLGDLFNKSATLHRLGALPILLIVLLIYALLFSLLDESWRPLSRGGLFLLGSMFITAALVGFTDTLAQGLWVRRQGGRPSVQFWPFNFVVAGGAVLFSRILPLHPGVLFGAPGGVDYGEFEPDVRTEHRLVGIGLLSLAALGGLAWAMSWAANQTGLALAAAGVARWPEWLTGLRNILLLLFLASLQVVFFQLLPIANTYGRQVMQINKLAWVVLFVPVAWLLSRVLINPDSAFLSVFLEAPVRALLIFLGGLVLFTTFVYFYFHRRAQAAQEQRAS